MKRGLGSFLYHIVQDWSHQASNFWPHTPQQKACLKMLQATECEAFLHSAANFRKNRSLFMICKNAHFNTIFFFYSTDRAVFKWLSKNQNQSNYSDQSQQEKAARWANHSS